MPFEELRREEFMARLGAAHAAVFTGRRVAEGAFQDQNWGQVLLPEDLRSFHERNRSAWEHALRRVGDDEFVMTETETCEKHTVSVVAPLEEEAFAQIFQRTKFAYFAFCVLFGRSGRWGLVVEEGFMCLGGEMEFMESFYEAAGDASLLRRRFFDIADTEWSGSQEYLDRVVAAVGW